MEQIFINYILKNLFSYSKYDSNIHHHQGEDIQKGVFCFVG